MRPWSRSPLAFWAAAVALVAMLAVVAIEWFTPSGADRTDRAAASSPPRESANAVRPMPADPAAFSWLLADVVHGDEGPQPRYRIVAGTFPDGVPSLRIEVPFPLVEEFGMTGRRPPVAGPVAGRVVYVADDGTSSAIHSVALDDPTDDRVVAEIDDVVWSVAVDPDGSTAFLQLVARDPAGGPVREVGVVGVSLDEGVAEPVLPAADIEPVTGIQRVAIVAFQAGLMLGADGSMLARSVCTGPDTCVTDVVDLRSGESWSWGRLDVVAMVPGAVVVRDSCDNAPPFACALAAVDLRTSDRRVLVEDIQGAQQATFAGRGVVVYGARIRADDTNATELRALDPVDGRDIHLLDAAPGGAIHVGLATFFHPPPGWTVVDTERGTLGVSLSGAEPIDLFIQLGGPEPACAPFCPQG